MATCLMTLGIISCEKVIDFEGQTTDPLLVLLSQPEADSSWTVYVGQSRFFLSTAPIPLIENAHVYVTVNGSEANDIAPSLGGGFYDSGIRPREGDSLSLRVLVPGHDEMVAGCRIPIRPTVSDASISYDTTMSRYEWIDSYDSVHVEQWISGFVQFKFKLHDPADKENFYMIRLAAYIDGEWDGGRWFTLDDDILFEINATDEIFDFEEYPENSGRQVLFSDERVNGEVHPITVTADLGTVSSSGYRYDSEFSIFPCRLEVYSISRDTYLYLKTRTAAYNSDVFTQILSEPIQIHTNVHGGIGFLGGMSKTIINF